MMVRAFNFSTQEAEGGGSLVWGQPGVCNKTPLKAKGENPINAYVR